MRMKYWLAEMFNQTDEERLIVRLARKSWSSRVNISTGSSPGTAMRNTQTYFAVLSVLR